MDLNLIQNHCAHCGAALRTPVENCPHCQERTVDPQVETLQRNVSAQGAGAIRGVLGDAGCASVACATLMLHYLDSDDTDVAAAAAEALQAARDPAVLQELVVFLGTRRWLGHLERGNFTEAEHGRHSISAVIRRVFSQPDDLHQEVLLEQLHHPDAHIREAAADLLQYQNSQKSIDALVSVLQHDRDAAVRARAAYALGHFCDSSTVDVLVHALKDESILVQSRAARALSRLGHGAVARAADTLATGSPEEALQSARLLGQVGSPEAIQALIDTLRNRRGLVRLYAEQALAQLGTDVLPTLLETLIHHSDSLGIREGIVYVLRTMGLPTREKELVQPVVEASDRLNAALEVPAAAYTALGGLLSLSADDLQARLRKI